MQYKTRLPSVYFDPSDLAELEALLLQNTTDASISIEVSTGSFTYTYDSIDDLVEDPTIPEILTDVEVAMAGKEGKIQLTLSSTHSRTENITVYGDRNWVRMKKGEITDFFESRKNLFRSEPYSTILFLFIGVSVVGILIGIPSITDIRDGFMGMLAMIVIALLISSLNSPGAFSAIYPYYIVKRNPNAEYNPYLRRVGRVILFLAAIITLISTPFIFGVV